MWKRQFEPRIYLNQFDFNCKFNKNFSRAQDCNEYLAEVKKEILIVLERQMQKIEDLEDERDHLKNSYAELHSKFKGFQEKHKKTVKFLEQQIERDRKKVGTDLVGIMRASKEAFEDDSVARL